LRKVCESCKDIDWRMIVKAVMYARRRKRLEGYLYSSLCFHNLGLKDTGMLPVSQKGQNILSSVWYGMKRQYITTTWYP